MEGGAAIFAAIIRKNNNLIEGAKVISPLIINSLRVWEVS
jgi:hypothetical protein